MTKGQRRVLVAFGFGLVAGLWLAWPSPKPPREHPKGIAEAKQASGEIDRLLAELEKD